MQFKHSWIITADSINSAVFWGCKAMYLGYIYANISEVFPASFIREKLAGPAVSPFQPH